MIDGEWQLDYPGTSLRWGKPSIGDPYGVYNSTYPDLGDTPIISEDAENPRKDGSIFGVDYFGGRTITFELAIVAPNEELTLVAQAAVARAWQADSVRSQAGAVATLATRNAGRERVVYGRPRRFAPVHDRKRKAGWAIIHCDFACTDHRFYATSDEGGVVPFVQTPTSGFQSPFVFPLSTVGTATSWNTITVSGEQPVWPVMRIVGPITNPTITVVPQGSSLLLPLASSALTDNWSLRLNVSLTAGTTVTIDTRPWRQSVTAGNGASLAGYLSRTSRIDRASLHPGTYAITLGGIDSTGTSRLIMSWRNSYASI